MLTHISDDNLERFFLNGIRSCQEIAEIEEHLLWCDSCIDRAKATECYVKTILRALGRFRDSEAGNPGPA